MQLTFWEGLELGAAEEVERLERGAVDDGCEHKCRSIPNHSHYRCSKAPLTFWEGPELVAVIAPDILERCAVPETCETISNQLYFSSILRSCVKLRSSGRSPKIKAFRHRIIRHSKHAS